jgi:SPP1 family predicted phage head-tail adaptor
MLKTKSEVMKQLGRVYKDKIILKKPVKVPDGQGGFKSDFQYVATVYSFFKKVKTAINEEAGAIVSAVTREIAIPNRPGIPAVKKGWQVLFGTKTFSIDQEPYDDDYNREKVLICREVVK